jgi:hypothetical protein
MQAGTTVAYADDRGHRADKGKSDNKAQISTKSSNQSSANVSVKAAISLWSSNASLRDSA